MLETNNKQGITKSVNLLDAQKALVLKLHNWRNDFNQNYLQFSISSQFDNPSWGSTISKLRN